MSRLQLLPLALIALLTGCTSDKDDTTLDGGGDSGPPDTGGPPDSGGFDDAAVPDTGPGPCQRDQGGPDNRGCEAGFVCNLAMDPPMCVAGRACTTDNDCNTCSDLVNPEECGHGYHLTAWCDPNHGNVCTRSRAPCEPCTETTDCGRVHPIFGGMNACVEYSATEKFCGRPCTQGCPDGFSCNNDNVCIRAGGCAEDPVICPQDPNGGVDCGRMAPSQICPGADCESGGPGPAPQCATNDQPGALGICIGFCDENSDCTDPAMPVCNLRNGICIAGCSKGSCPSGQVCHVDGFCAPPCAEDVDCTDDTRYGPNTYCNIPPPPQRPPPRYYKGGPNGYRDDFACAPLGCERKVDCVVPGIVCDLIQSPPTCVPGCYENNDCRAGEKCKVPDGPPPQTEQECRQLEQKMEGEDSIGLCCDPGCEDLELDCGFNEFCCGEDKSPNVTEPYENTNACLPTTSTGAQALPGECFEMGTNPWCRDCFDAMAGNPSNEICNMPRSGWQAGFNDVDGNGTLVNEQEYCSQIGMGGPFVCSVTCNPDNALMGIHMCPRTWVCGPLTVACFQDADCNGLTCIGANPPMNIPGACRCGENGAATAVCPVTGLRGDIENPRCVENQQGGLNVPGGMPGEFYCVEAFNCFPPQLRVDMMTGDTNYPDACGF